MHDTSARVFETNLACLAPATRAALGIGAAGDTARVKAQPPHHRLLVSTPGGEWVPIHASDDPVATSDAIVARMVQNGAPPLVVAVGLGLGYLLDAIERANTTTRVLAVEPVPAITRAMLARRDWSDWLTSGRLTILVGPDYSGAADAWRLFGSGAPKPPTIIAPLIDREFPEAAARAKAVLGQIFGGVQANDEARRQFAGRYLLNTFTNLPAIAAEGDVSSLKRAFVNTPAVVVGAGPSLDLNLSMIEALKGKALVIAVDTALRPLLAAGITPHLVVGVDPSELNARHLHNLPAMSGAWLVAEGSLDASVFPPFADRTFFFHVSDHHPWPWLAEQGSGRGRLRAWGSVLTTAFDLAAEAGCDPIVFAGADLAYSRGLQYCRNTTYEPDWRDCPDDVARAERFKQYLKQRPAVSERDVHGRDVLTATHFIQFRDWIVSRAAELAPRRVLNATGGGILHGHGVEQVEAVRLQLTDFPEREGLDRRIARAWASGADIRVEALQRLDVALAAREALPMEEWVAFGGDTAPAHRIDETVEKTTREIHARAEAAVHIQKERERHDRHATSVDVARTLMHPDYDFACAQASAQQTHILLDVMQRTHPVQPGAPTADAVRAAATPPERLRVLDFGCGLGRAMAPLVDAGFDVDGVDFSARMISLARQDPRFARSQFFISSGMDLGQAPEAAYDLVTALHAFHRIRPRVVRLALLQSMARALRPGGTVAIQMPFFPDRQAHTVNRPNVPWSVDVVESTADDRVGEVWCTPDELPLIFEDFSRHFRDLRLQFVDFPTETVRFGTASTARLCHIVISGSTSHRLAARMYAPIEKI